MSEIDEAMQRNDAIRVLQLAIASVEYPADDPAQVLRNIEEGGYTLRLTTNEERAAKRRDLEVEIFGSAAPLHTAAALSSPETTPAPDAGLDVDRLARAFENATGDRSWRAFGKHTRAAIAAEYDRLALPQPGEPT